MHHPTDRITHTTAFVTPVVEHLLEREIAQWVHPMSDRSDDPSHHERTLYLCATSRSWDVLKIVVVIYHVFKIIVVIVLLCLFICCCGLFCVVFLCVFLFRFCFLDGSTLCLILHLIYIIIGGS